MAAAALAAAAAAAAMAAAAAAAAAAAQVHPLPFFHEELSHLLLHSLCGADG